MNNSDTIMKCKILLLFIAFSLTGFAQKKRAADFGFRHAQFVYKGDTVDVLIKSKKGEELKSKPLLLFCQGSMPQPLIKTDGELVYGVFPFSPDTLLKDYHIAIVSKPYIPLIKDKKDLDENFCFRDTVNGGLKKYSDRNYLDYYVKRNIEVIKFLQKQTFITKEKLVVAGHSEGSTIAAKLALEYKKVTHLIYSGGNPCGRILSMIMEGRSHEKDSSGYGEAYISSWKSISNDPKNMDMTHGDSFKTTSSFSYPPKEYIKKLKIPVLVCYGTKDWASPFNDYMQVDFIRTKKTNVTFYSYIGLEHNYFSLKESGRVNYDIFNWDKVAVDWQNWLKTLK